jgi:hypothetical protein
MVDKRVTRSPDAAKTAPQLLKERTQRLRDAMELRQPDRIPIQLAISYMLAETAASRSRTPRESGLARTCWRRRRSVSAGHPSSGPPVRPEPHLLLGDPQPAGRDTDWILTAFSLSRTGS